MTAQEGFLQITEYTLPIAGITQNTTLLAIADLHLSVAEEESEPAYKARVANEKKQWEELRLQFARLSGDSIEKQHLLPPEEGLSVILDYANHSGADGVLFAGDMLNTPSRENETFFSKALSGLSLPYLWVRGNHEAGATLSPNDKTEILTLNGLRLIGIDNADGRLSESALAAIREEVRPTVLCMHVPPCTEPNADPYFFMNEIESEKLKKILRLHPAAAVLCGHLHRRYESKICGIPLICTSSAMVGALSLIHFTLKNNPESGKE